MYRMHKQNHECVIVKIEEKKKCNGCFKNTSKSVFNINQNKPLIIGAQGISPDQMPGKRPELLRVAGNIFIDGDMTLKGSVDPTSLILTGNETNTFINMANGSAVPVPPPDQARIRYNDSLQLIEVSEDGAPYRSTQGLQGPIGAQGAQGAVGNQGNAGAPGTVGFLGSQGFQGAQGELGPQGSSGPLGPQGFFGNIGAVGNAGPRGPTGAQGTSLSLVASSLYLTNDFVHLDDFYQDIRFDNASNGGISGNLLFIQVTGIYQISLTAFVRVSANNSDASIALYV